MDGLATIAAADCYRYSGRTTPATMQQPRSTLRPRFADKKLWTLRLPQHQYDWLEAQRCPAHPTRIQVLRSLIQAAIDADAIAGNG